MVLDAVNCRSCGGSGETQYTVYIENELKDSGVRPCSRCRGRGYYRLGHDLIPILDDEDKTRRLHLALDRAVLAVERAFEQRTMKKSQLTKYFSEGSDL